MAQKMKVDDEIRLKILDAMMDKKSTQPNMRKIKSKTGYHLATIKGSIDFLQKEGIITGYGPKISFWKLDYKLEVVELLQVDFSRQDLIDQFFEIAKDDPHIYTMQSIMGSGNFNIISFQFYKDVESYHKNLSERYVQKIPNYYSVVKDRQVFYLTAPTFKRGSRTDSIVKILMREAGID
jgi:DNA-binding Lrp family transcriptional regulator